MKTIHQLRKVGLRLPRIASRCLNKLTRKKLTESQVQFYRAQLGSLPAAYQLLGEELRNRRVGMTPFRCALPLKKQRQMLEGNSELEQKLLSGQKLAA